MENLLLGLMLTAALVLPYALLLEPLAETMLAVKIELCGGNLEFVMGVKDDLVRVVTTSASVSSSTNLTYIETAVQEYAFPSSVQERLSRPVLEPDITRAREMLNQGYGDWKREKDLCLQHGEGTNSSDFIASAAFAVGKPGATSCEELKYYCSDSAHDWLFSNAAVWLRMACPRSCGCTKPFVLPIMRTPRWGCSLACIQESYNFSYSALSPLFGNAPNFSAGCKDVAYGTEAFHGLQLFYALFVDLMSVHNNYDYSQHQEIVEFAAWASYVGCPALRVQPVDFSGNLACRGSSKYLPLAWFCPETCGCASSGNTERDHFCFAYDYCPMHVLPNEIDKAWRLIRKYDLLKTLMNPQLLSYDAE